MPVRTVGRWVSPLVEGRWNVAIKVRGKEIPKAVEKKSSRKSWACQLSPFHTSVCVGSSAPTHLKAVLSIPPRSKLHSDELRDDLVEAFPENCQFLLELG
jgi:hypothetical protein